MWWPFAHDCTKHGHRYTQRYDELPDPRLSAEQVQDLSSWSHKLLPFVKFYVRDVCEFCGDVIDRTEGEHPLKALARQSR